jgi:hypothetical protein
VRFGRSFPVPAHQQIPFNGAQTYYVSSTGSDSNNGLSPLTPWQTITKVNAHTFVPGDTILFLTGNTFSGAIYVPQNSGTAANPVTFGSYGTGQATISSSSFGFYVYDTSGVIVDNLTITGSSALSAGDGGVEFYADNGLYANIQVNNCNISGFTSGISIGGSSGGGFTNVTVSGGSVSGNRDNGLITYGPSFNTGAPAYAHSNVTVTGLYAYSNLGNSSNTTSQSGNGIVLGSVTTGTVTLCAAYGNGTNNAYTGGGPVGIWTYASTGVTISSCVAYSNKSGTGADGDGFDLDIDTTYCTIEYCLAYSNYGAGILAYGTNSSWTTNTVRYCITYGNGQNPSGGYGAEMAVPGTTNSLICYNNTFVATGTNQPLYLAGSHTGDVFWNNIFSAASGKSVYSTTAYTTSQVEMQGNDYWSTSGMSVQWGTTDYTTLAAWQSATSQELNSGTPTGYAITPGLVSAGSAPTVTNPAALAGATGFDLASTSGLLGAGLDIYGLFGHNIGSSDYFGNSPASPFNIGAYSGVGLSPYETGLGVPGSMLAQPGRLIPASVGVPAASPPSASGTGTLSFVGSGSSTLSLPTSTATAVVALSGSGASTLSVPTSSATGAVSISGTGSATPSLQAGAGTGTVAFTGTGSTSSSLGATGSGALSFSGAGSTTLQVATAGSGAVSFSGSGSTTPTISLGTSVGTLSFVGSGSSVLSIPASATGTLSFAGTGSTTLTVATGASTGTLTFTGAGQASQVGAGTATGLLTIAGTGTAGPVVPTTGTAVVTFAGGGSTTVRLAAAGAGLVAFTGSGTPTVHLSAIGTGLLELVGTGTASNGSVVPIDQTIQLTVPLTANVLGVPLSVSGITVPLTANQLEVTA